MGLDAEQQRVRVHIWKDMGALIDKFISSDIAGDVQQLLATLDYLSALSPPTQQGAPSPAGSAPQQAQAQRQRATQSDYAQKFQACMAAPNNNNPGDPCADILEHLEVMTVPPFPPPPVVFSKKLAPLAPLSFKPRMPPLPEQCCPTFRRKIEEALGWRVKNAGEGDGAGGSGGGSRSAMEEPARPSMHRGGSGGGGATIKAGAHGNMGDRGVGGGGGGDGFRSAFSTAEDPRQVSDRQLQEQLNRLAQENQGPYRRDDPMVILTLSGRCVG